MDSYVSPAELAKHEDISISLIRRLMREGVLEFIEYSPKVRKIPMRAWEAYKQQQTKKFALRICCGVRTYNRKPATH